MIRHILGKLPVALLAFESKSLSQQEVALPLAWNELLVDEAHIVALPSE